MAAGAPIIVTETSKGEFRVELQVDANTLKINDQGALEAKVVGAEATTPLTVTTANDVRTFTLNFDNNSLVVKDNALRLAGKHIIHATPTSGLFMVPDATTGEMYLNYKTDNDTVARDSVFGELHLRRVPVKDKGGLAQTEVLYTPIPGDPGTPGIKWYELSLNADEITTFLDPRNGALHAEPALLTNSGIRKEDLLNNMRSIGLSVDNLTAVIEPRPNNPDGSAHPGLLRSIPVVVPNAGLEVQNFSETETYPKRLAVLVDGSTVVLTNGKVTGNYVSGTPGPVGAHLTITGNSITLVDAASGTALATLQGEVTALGVTVGNHTTFLAALMAGEAGSMGLEAYLNQELAKKQNLHQNLTNLSSNTPFLDKPLEIREETKVKRLVVTDTSALAAPSMTSRSAGTRAILWPGTFGGSNTDMALGVEANHVWMSSYSPDQGFKWYTGDVLRMHLQGTSGVMEFKARPTVNGKTVLAYGDTIRSDGPADGTTQVHHELRAGNEVRWSWIVRGGGTAGTAGAQYLALRRHDDDELPATPQAEAFAVDRYTGVTDFKFRPTHNGTALATVGDVSASAFSTFANDTWINSADGKRRFYFGANGATYISAPGALNFRTGTPETEVDRMYLSADGTKLVFGTDSAAYRHFEIKNANATAYALVAVFADQAGALALIQNGSTRSTDGGANTGTLRNDAGMLRLHAKGDKGIRIAADTGDVTIDGVLNPRLANNAWINSAEGSARLFFQNGAETILRSANSTFYFRTFDNVANMVRLNTAELVFGEGQPADYRILQVKNPRADRFAEFGVIADQAGGCFLSMSGSTRDGLQNLAKLENTVGSLQLRAKGAKGITIAADTGNATVDGDLGFSGYRKVVIPGGNLTGYLYGAYNTLGEGIHLGCNAFNDNAAWVVPVAWGATSRLRVADGIFQFFTGAAGQAPLTEQLRISQTGTEFRNGHVKAIMGAFVCNAGTGGTFHYVMQNAAVNRWAIGLTNTESGTDTGSDFALWCNKNDGTPGTLYNPLTIRRTDGVADFKARPTFNGSALALLSEVTGGGGSFTTFNNDAWINSADNVPRLWFSANNWSILNSPTSIGFRTGNASAGPDKMVLDGNGCLAQTVSGTAISIPINALQPALAAGQFNAVQIGKAGSTYNSARVLYNHSGDNSANNTVTLGLWGSPALTVNGWGVATAPEFGVGNGQWGSVAVATNYFPDSGVGDMILRVQNNKALLMGTSTSRNADLRIETDGTVNFRAKPKTGGVELATTTELTNQRTAILNTDGPSRFGIAYTKLASDVDTLTTDGTAVWSYPLTFKTKNLRTYSHLVFHIELSAYVAALQTGTMVADIVYTPRDMQNQYTETLGVRRGAGGSSSTYGGHLSLTFFTAWHPIWESGFDVAGNTNVVFRLTLGGWRTNAGNRFNLMMKEEPTTIGG